MRWMRLLAMVVSVTLVGCATVPEGTPPAPEVVPVIAREDMPPLSGAVLALWQQAETRQAGGDLERAAVALERALRIEPRNAWLWHRLAIVRHAQQRDDLAANLVAKSAALAGDDARLRERNERLLVDIQARR